MEVGYSVWDWKPQRNRDITIYQQILEYLERRIFYGELSPGSRLPSERQLARYLGVNRSTIISVYQELEAKGLVEAFKRQGTYVCTRLDSGRKQSLLWHRYMKENSIPPNLSLYRRVQEEAQNDRCINFTGDLLEPLFPHDPLSDVIAENRFTESLKYEHPQGHLPLRQTISEHMKKYYNMDVTSSSVLVTSGAQQSLYLITHSLLHPGDAIAVEKPSYFCSLPLFQSAGLRLFPLSVDEHGVHPEEVEELYRKHRIQMVFLNPTYQNPTGYTLSLQRRKELLKVCSTFRIPIVEDDPFSLLAPEPVAPPLKAMDPYGLVLYIGSLSKVVASNLRVGWLIGPQEIMDRLGDVRQQMDYGLSIFPQWVAHLFLSSSHFHSHVHELQLALQRRKQLLVTLLQQHLGQYVTFHPPHGGIHLWCQIKHPVQDIKLLEAAIRKKVLYMPGSVYGAKDGHARFTFSRPYEEEMEEGVLRFKKALDIL
ncbi:PLP-dependent aminotransferase family protein [Kroppenstedtia pulmonis]|uniref:PLP-dependent aminotransferase family protein n=1 Tax=Kroppenstedtia pulmonis TaxID=1380685 RepID=A0A7D4B374_9BACL|nr:PLP-dependent aminotransferase family protein [Kroppenstedtia pulmonis]